MGAGVPGAGVPEADAHLGSARPSAPEPLGAAAAGGRGRSGGGAGAAATLRPGGSSTSRRAVQVGVGRGQAPGGRLPPESGQWGRAGSRALLGVDAFSGGVWVSGDPLDSQGTPCRACTGSEFLP